MHVHKCILLHYMAHTSRLNVYIVFSCNVIVLMIMMTLCTNGYSKDNNWHVYYLNSGYIYN